MESTLRYKNYQGKLNTFNITNETCLEFGFEHGQRVEMPDGRLATTIGVQISGCPWCSEFGICPKGKHAPTLWFHIDGEEGATFFPLFSKEAFEKAGFKLTA